MGLPDDVEPRRRPSRAPADGRRHPRTRLAWPAIVRAGSRSHKTETLDLSPYGAKVRLRGGVDVGVMIRLNFRPPGRPSFDVDGIVWRKDKDGLAIVFLSPDGPADSIARAIAQANPNAQRPEDKGPTILLVEEDAEARGSARAVLEAEGYGVLDADGDSAKAIRLAGAHAGPIHLLLTDVATSTVNGLHLLEELAPQRPGMNVLFISAHRVNGKALAGTHFLAKPFTAEELVTKVRELLSGRVYFERRRS